MSFLYKPVEHILTFASKIILAAANAFKPVEGVKVFQGFFFNFSTLPTIEQYKTFLQNQCVAYTYIGLAFF